MEAKIKRLIAHAIQDIDADALLDIQLTIPQLQFGDFSTNIALILAKKQKKNPMGLAEKIKQNMKVDEDIESVQVLKPGFINIWLSKKTLLQKFITIAINDEQWGKSTILKDKKIMVEYTDPNFFKEFHVGHLYSNIVGESIARLFEVSGAIVKRANYQGDVGMHVAKYIWGMIQKMKDESLTLEKINHFKLADKAKFMGQAYTLGTQAFEKSEELKKEIGEINKKIYTLDPEILKFYDTSRKWTLAYYETVYERLGTKFDYYYFEREAGKIGLELVKKYLKGGIFETSDGATIFHGENYGLHTRVFINSAGFPTYEAKDLGLALTKYEDFPYDSSLIVVGSEVKEYFTVVLKALEKINPELRKKTSHIFHGMVRLPEGKMSSRLGNIVTGTWLLDESAKKAKEKIQEVKKVGNNEEGSKVVLDKQDETAEIVGLAAIKYALLKNNVGGNIKFDFDESVSFEGNSGPYLQYTYVRCQSVLEKTDMLDFASLTRTISSLNEDESSLLRLCYQFPEIVSKSAVSKCPNYVATYLFDLAQTFNFFYQKNPILKAEEDKKKLRLLLTKITSQIIKEGLYLLGIQTVQKM